MTTLSLSDPSNGTTADATLIASNNAAIRTVVNGNIDSSNIAAAILAQLIPTGTILPWSGPSSGVPSGFLLCDGAAVPRASFPALNSLYSADSYRYGNGNGTTTFNVPNMKGKVAVGVDTGQTEFDVLGETGGEKTHVLTTAELASHNHGGATGGGTTGTQSANHTHTLNDAYLLNSTGVQAGFNVSNGAGTTVQYRNAGTGLTATESANHTHAVPALGIAADGSGTAHNNLQPYISMHYMVKT